MPATHALRFEVRVWPADNLAGGGTVVHILSGVIPQDLHELGGEFTFELLEDYDFVRNRYADFDVELIQPGNHIEVTVFETNTLTKFEGEI